MPAIRLCVAALVLAVSPLGAAVCEVVCGSPVHAAAHAPVEAAPQAADHDQHAHHAQHGHPAPAAALPAQANDVDTRLSGPAAACPPLSTAPARIRASFDPYLDCAVAGATSAAVLNDAPLAHRDPPSAATDPPDPPHHAPVPLRI